MLREPIPAPGVILGAYPENVGTRRPSRAAAALRARWDGLGWVQAARQRRLSEAADRVLAHVEALQALSDASLFAGLQTARAELARDGFASPVAERALALVTLALRATRGLTPRRNQLMAALAVLQGRLAEVPTGEGKTLASALAACVAALAGVPVHLITSNDYLAGRDADQLRPLALRLGLTVGVIAQAMDAPARRAAYAASITFCSAREIVFDYLRDRLHAPPALTRGPQPASGRVLRGLCMAIVDEADSVLIDEAATPFILSESFAEPAQVAVCTQALRIAARLRAGFDFRVDARSSAIELTPAGQTAIAAAPSDIANTLWSIPRYREEMTQHAIRALHLLKRDVDYLVHDDTVHIIDANSGRLAHGRAWSHGLHQMVEIKERCAPTPATRVLAQITFQRFFARYLHVGGMSGTLTEARAELMESYGLPVLPIPTGRPTRLTIAAPRAFARAATRWQAVVAEIARHHAAGRPVLAGTDSVRESERLSRLLDQAGLPHRVLNARQDSEEAALIADAGRPGAITVTTNMAGRGTDIHIDERVARLGGLHVVSCQHNSARRIDRQLFGRAGRLGQPGSALALLSLEEGLLGRYLSPRARRLLSFCSRDGGTIPLVIGSALVRLTQHLEERRTCAIRRGLREQDAGQDTQQLFGQRPE